MRNQKHFGRIVVRTLERTALFVLLTLLLSALVLLGAVYVTERGPSATAAALFFRSAEETDVLRPAAGLFLSEEERSTCQNPTDAEETAQNVSLIHPEQSAAASSELPYLSVEDVSGSTYKGKMMIVRDARSLLVGTADDGETGNGARLGELVRKYDGIAGINGGVSASDGTPRGLVIVRDTILNGNENGRYSLAGITESGVLLVGNMTGREALENHVRWAVSYCADGAASGALVVNGEVQEGNLVGGLKARTAIGQRADGSILLLVLDGGRLGSLGATRRDVCHVMLSYGAVNVAELEGGASSAMVHRGETVSRGNLLIPARRVPDAFIVLREGSYE